MSTPAREMRGGRREDVARVKRARHVARGGSAGRRARAPPRRRRRRRRASAGRCRARRTCGRRASRTATARRVAADTGIDDREVHADRQVRDACCAARSRPAAPPAARCRASRRSRARRARCRAITPWHVADEVVLQPEVGEERDDAHVHASPSHRAPRRRGRRDRASPPRPRPRARPTRATRVVSGPIVTAGAAPPIPA